MNRRDMILALASVPILQLLPQTPHAPIEPTSDAGRVTYDGDNLTLEGGTFHVYQPLSAMGVLTIKNCEVYMHKGGIDVGRGVTFVDCIIHKLDDSGPMFTIKGPGPVRIDGGGCPVFDSDGEGIMNAPRKAPNGRPT